MGNVLNFEGRVIDKRVRPFLADALNTYGNNAKIQARNVNAMSDDKLAAVVGTYQLAEASGLLQKLLELKADGVDVSRETQEVFRGFLTSYEFLVEFYADKLEIDLEKVF